MLDYIEKKIIERKGNTDFESYFWGRRYTIPYNFKGEGDLKCWVGVKKNKNESGHSLSAHL